MSASAKEKLASPLPRIFMAFSHFLTVVVNNKESDSCFLGGGREDSSTHFPLLSLSLSPPFFSKWPVGTIPYLTLLYSKEAAAGLDPNLELL